ncbi:MAG: glucose-6-phosphate dehydrogenase assembly protein OpcA [Candidatus Dormibacteraeota bacterium]|nr:glucose-6-phosphate dehydrogenase assembly protein OpcA [Candidatus Dormibacteraeota bacterium]
MSTVTPAWRGTDVGVSDVLEQLKVLRARAAGRPRSSVLDVIIVATDAGEAKAAATAVEKLSSHHPCRALVVLDEPGPGSSRMDVTITERGDRGEDGANPVHEEVFLRVRGPAADHLPGLVESLLVPDVVTFVWWTGSPPLRGAGFHSSLEVADVLLLDSARFARPYESFAALAEVAGASTTVFGDFHWTRLAPWREVLAQFFNPIDRRGFLRGIGALGVDYNAVGRGNRSAAVLLAGWLGSALGWRLKRVRAGTGGVRAANFFSPERHPVELALRPVEMAGFAAGEITGIRIDAVSEGQTCLVHAFRDEADNGHVIVEGELRGRPFPRTVLPMPARTDEAVLSRLLIDARSDRAYPRALQLGAEILRSAKS